MEIIICETVAYASRQWHAKATCRNYVDYDYDSGFCLDRPNLAPAGSMESEATLVPSYLFIQPTESIVCPLRAELDWLNHQRFLGR